MDRLWRFNSSVSSRTGCPLDIVNEEDHTVEENEFSDFQKWNIPKVDTKAVYKTSWTENAFHFAYKVRTIEQTFFISKTHEKCCLFSKRNIGEFIAKKFSYLHIGLVQVLVKPLTRKGINASVLMCLQDARFKNFKDSILGTIIASLYDGPVYFTCYPDITLTLNDPNIVKALTLNIASSGYHIEEGSKPFALIYCIYYRLLGTQLNPGVRINREPVGKTMLIKCSTPDAKVQVPKMIQWQDVKLPTKWLLEQESPLAKLAFDELDLTNIQQYLDGIVKISFQNNQPLKINEGRHSFVGGRHSFAGSKSISISRRDQDLNEFLQKNFEKPDLRLKGVSSGNSQVSIVFYSTKLETSSPYGRIANEEEEDTRSVCPSVFDFPLLKPLITQIN